MKTASLQNVVGFVRRIAVHEAAALSDRELLDRFVERRDEFAFAELVRRHGPMVLAAGRRVLRHEHDAEDVFQAAFLVLARRASTIRQSETLSGWLYQVAYRLALRARDITNRRREQRLQPEATPCAKLPPDAFALDDELARLPHEYRSVVVLCYLEGRTQDEAARLLETTADAVNSRLKRARELMRERYARIGIAALFATVAASHALGRETIGNTVRNSVAYAASGTCSASALAITLAKGAIPMFGSTTKMFAALALLAGLLLAGVFFATPTSGNDHSGIAPAPSPVALAAEPIDKAKAKRGCIILWMS
ncbi:MAG TPA: sigma-70 family RNA polymerase sigma factor, partial [Candidatus Cybelea sp.]|nr:sigma-70 family RNA polymerase sigma factor [Candidatus Cybelea sp.]